MSITTIDVGRLGVQHQRLWRGSRCLYLLIPIPVLMVYLVQTGVPLLDHLVFFGGPVVLLAAFATALLVSGRFVASWGTIAGVIFGLFLMINIVVVGDKFVPALLDGSIAEAGVFGTNVAYLASLLLVAVAARSGLTLGRAEVPALGARFGEVLRLTGRSAARRSVHAALAFRGTPSGWLRIVLGVFLLGVAFWLFVLDNALPGLGLGGTPSDIYLPVSIAGFALLALCCTLLVRHGLRQVRLDARAQMEADARSPVVLLRSFKDDQARLRPVGFLARLQLRCCRLEEAVAREVDMLGPFIAVGTPGESLPELGAHRAYLQDGEWQRAVLDWIDRSRVVLMVAGTTPWVAWELQALRDAAALPKLLLLFPPGGAADRSARWQLVCGCLRDSAWGGRLADADLSRAIALSFQPDGGIVTISGAQATERDCRLAVRVGLYELLTRQDATVAAGRSRTAMPAGDGSR